MGDSKQSSGIKLGRFSIRNEGENGDDISAGSIFTHRQDLEVNPENKNTFSQGNENASSSKAIANRKEVKHHEKTTEPQHFRCNITSGNGKVTSKRNGDTRPAVKRKRDTGSSQETSEKKSKALRKPFGKLLEGVTLVISGYQNPTRGNLRSLALDMGALYKSFWDSSCTHLICAFPNTPKFQEVWGKGHIVRKEWIENCHSKRKRLPWRRYALDKRDLSKPESEEEILELTGEFTSSSSSEPDSTSQVGSDTEDEIEKAIAYNKHTDETDLESETDLPDISKYSLPQLPNVFHGKCFYLNNDLDEDRKYKLHRYIFALGGKLLNSIEDNKLDYIISEQKVESEHTVLKPEWVWRCNDAKSLIPVEKFELS